MNLYTLLQRSEGDTLDFKRENYRFRGELDDEKSELLKDILAMANAWKATDAQIIIGVEESHGRASAILGVVPELNDSDIQQFVSAKINRPIAFSIEHLEHDEKRLTVIRVNQKQPRPIYLNKNFGRLKKHVVYIRHGSSTEEASPDEIAEMAKQDIVSNAPDVEIGFQITVDAFCYSSEFSSFGIRKEEPTYSDGFELIVHNKGTALAQHIEGSIELPSGVLLDFLDMETFKNEDPLTAVARSKSVKLQFSNYLSEPRRTYMAKPNPKEWKPLLPGRKMSLMIEKAVPLRKRFCAIDATVKWELAVDNCSLRRGEIKFAEILVVKNES